MTSKSDDRILHLRNESSCIIDDVVALVINSALAQELRLFSEDVMSRTPGFTFNLNQARALKKLSERTLRLYQSRQLDDVGLMNYLTNAHSLLKGEALQNGGNPMAQNKPHGLFGSLFQSKEAREQQAIQDVRQHKQKLQQEMLQLAETMQRCVQESRGLAPDSVQYRINERKYEDAEKMLQLKEKAFKSALNMLSEVERQKAIEEYNEFQRQLLDTMNKIVGSTDQLTQVVDKANYFTKKIDSELGDRKIATKELYDTINTDSDVANEKFNSAVAADARNADREAMLGQEFAPAAEPKNKFASLVQQTDSGNQ